MTVVNQLTQAMKELLFLKPNATIFNGFLKCGLPFGQVIKINNKPVVNCPQWPLMEGFPL